jgi:hypothetical protein
MGRGRGRDMGTVCWGVGYHPATSLRRVWRECRFSWGSATTPPIWSLSFFGLIRKQTGLPKVGGGDSCPNKRTATDKPETHLLFLSVKRRGRGDLSGRSEKIKPEYKSTVFVGVATPGQGKTRPPCATGCVVPLPGLCLPVGSPVA